MEQFFRYLESHNITSFLIRETAHPAHLGESHYEDMNEAVSFLSDGIIVVYNVLYPNMHRKRALEILKMRGENIDRRIVEMEIVKDKGVVVENTKPIKGHYKLT
jgi:KaiC/GvpD/RAD55 family RecA-like ATPase